VNTNKRMIDFLRRSWHPRIETEEPEKELCFWHMMNERVRRERQKQSYMALPSMLPFGTKVRGFCKKLNSLFFCYCFCYDS
jgi:hypothetical protein